MFERLKRTLGLEKGFLHSIGADKESREALARKIVKMREDKVARETQENTKQEIMEHLDAARSLVSIRN